MKLRIQGVGGVVENQNLLAVLIDAENAQPSVVSGLLAEVAKYGTATVKRIYGDWTSTKHSQWKATLLKHSLTPIQQFAYTKGKNATDSALIIDAMDLMYTRRFTGFCLVSSDSDFTRLAQRLREEGLTVFGFGKKGTPEAFVSACDKFIYTELLGPSPVTKSPPKTAVTKVAKKSSASNGSTVSKGSTVEAEVQDVTAAADLITEAIDKSSDEQGWAGLADVGSYLTKVRPGFDPRLYGCSKLSDLIRKLPGLFVLTQRPIPGSGGKHLFVRSKARTVEVESALEVLVPLED